MNGAILVVDDEALPRKNIGRVLREEGYEVKEAGDGQEGIDLIDAAEFDIVLTDIIMPRADGIALLKHIRRVSPQTFVLIMTAYASVETAVTALQLGSQDYLLKPIVFDDLLRKIRLLLEYRHQAWEIQMLRRQVNDLITVEHLVGKSPAMQNVSRLIQKVGPAASTVLITGESGTGKEVVARTIHEASPQRDKIFLPINCSAIPETLLESQLFGYVKGAFTGASSSQEGLFQRARGGTIFLDELAEMPVSLQPKLLRALESKEVLPVGATTPVRVEVRILAATNRDLDDEIAAGRFREDLFYRLNVISLHLPPLRERREDIPILADYLIHRHNLQMKKNYKGVDNGGMKTLISLPWRGNIRELDNVLERAMILGEGEWITEADLPSLPTAGAVPPVPIGHNLREAVHIYEKTHIENVLQETRGDRTRTADLLGVSRSSLYRKMEQLGIPLENS